MKRTTVIDMVALLGVALVSGGVYMKFGLGSALMACGGMLLALAIYAGWLNGEEDAADSE